MPKTIKNIRNSGKNPAHKKAMPEDYSEDYLFNVCGNSGNIEKGIFDKRFTEAVSLAKIKNNDLVLDVGGGRGEIALLASTLGAKVTVIDYSKTAIEIIKRFSQKPLFGGLNICVKLMDAQKLKFKNSSFDKIFFLEVLEHLTAKELNRALKEMLRVLKPEGILIISTSPNKILMNLLLQMTKLSLGNREWKSRKYHINEQSFFSLKKLFRNYDISYKIYLKEGKGFFYNQIKNNPDLSPKLKNFVKIFNDIYDLKICKLIKSLPVLNILFCTSFLIEIRKADSYF